MSDKFCNFPECAVSWCCSDSPSLPLQQMLPAEGSCQLIEAAAAAAGLSSKTRSGHLIMLLVHSSPLNCAAVIKWEK